MNVSSELHLEDLTITFDADMTECDFGPGTPVDVEISYPTVTYVEILGVSVDIKTLPAALIAEMVRLSGDVDVDDWG
jgi:hypothetical protein